MEDPALLLGIPLLVVGTLGVLLAMSTLVSAVGVPPWLLEPVGGAEALTPPEAPHDAAPARPPATAVAAAEHEHPKTWEYIQIGLALSVVTAVEVVVYYVDALKDALIAILLVLSALKFALVVLWFMHLRFESRTLSQLFAGGLMLAAAVFIVVLATLGASLV